ncbi:hypothetical protein [Marinobacter sp. KMM 10035]|uniref:hypothetical protein n=1 Tax=Marinobacter sp. KMM 10035 TaxID=3134034 RepID=UPI00397899A9
MKGKVLFVGGTGTVGRQAVKYFRQRHPDLPIMIGGRNLENASSMAIEVGNAEAVRIDLDKPFLGLGSDASLSAVVMMTPDDNLKALSYAQDMHIPYLSIGNWLVEVGAEMAHFARRPNASPVVLASHWHGGAAVFLALATAKDLDSVQSVKIGAVVDPIDPTGPNAIDDMERAGDGVSGILAFEGGRRVWLTGSSALKTVQTIDGRSLQASAFAPYDIVSLQAATGADDVRFDLATGISSSRLRGGNLSTEHILEIEGEVGGSPRQRRSTIEFTKGQAALTGLSAMLSLSTVLGYEGHPPVPPGLYFPELLMDTDWFLDELVQAGAVVVVDSD